MTLVRVNEKNSGGDFLILNLQAVSMVKCRHFENEQKRHQAMVFSHDRSWVKLMSTAVGRTGERSGRRVGDGDDGSGNREDR